MNISKMDALAMKKAVYSFHYKTNNLKIGKVPILYWVGKRIYFGNDKKRSTDSVFIKKRGPPPESWAKRSSQNVDVSWSTSLLSTET